jgi:oligoendopeptidase F
MGYADDQPPPGKSVRAWRSSPGACPKVLVLALCLSGAQLAVAQAGLETAHISPTLYFRSEADELASRMALHAEVSHEINALALTNPQALIKELDRSESLIAALQTHDAFLKIRTLEDTQDQSAKKARNEVETDQSVLEAAMNARLRRLSPKEMDSLGRYALLARTAQQDVAHALSSATEQYRGAVIDPTLTSFADAYDRIENRLPRPKEVSATDTAIRRKALAAWNEAYNHTAPEEADLLGAIVELENRDAIAQGYKNAADRKYQLRGLSDALVTRTLAAVQAEAPAYRHYQEVLAQHAARVLGVSPVLSSEVDLASTKAPAIPLPDAKALILSGLQPLGTDYTNRFAALLDPTNGRLDLAGGKHRAHTGTSIDAYDAPTALYYGGYDGSLRDVSKIAHEGGHAIHHELMNAVGGPIYGRSGPNFFSEGFAIFNELLLLDHATEVPTTPIQKEYALERLLSKLSLELFVSAEETAFERSLYVQSIGQPLLDRAKIDSLYQASIAPYEYWAPSDVGQSRLWMRKALLFEDPLYLENYLYASVIAVALYNKSHSDPEFAKRYEALLRRGFDSEPQDLLSSIGIRLDDPALVQPAAHLLTEKTNELQQLYSQDLNR